MSAKHQSLCTSLVSIAVVRDCDAKQYRGKRAPSIELVKLAGASVQELDLWVMRKRLLLQGFQH